MVSEKFRHQLKKEVEQWRAEQLIDEPLYTELLQRYQLTTLETTAKNRFVIILIGLGSILLGLAAITFVAANWQVWSRFVKIILLMGLFVGINSTGFYLWRYPHECWQHRLGQGLLLLGMLMMGANLGLMSQLFHQSGPIHQLFIVWAFGVLVMAYGLELTSLAIFSIILAGIAYLSEIWQLWYPTQALEFQLILEHLSLLVSFLWIPLAYRLRSRWLFILTILLIFIALENNISLLYYKFSGSSTIISGVLSAIAVTLPPALLWAYRDSLWSISSSTLFDNISRKFSIFFLSLMFYILSFNFWQYTPYNGGRENNLNNWFDWLDLVLFSGFTLWSWWKLGYENSSKWRIDLTTQVILGMLISTGIIVGWFASGHALYSFPPFIFNAFLFTLAVGLIRESIDSGIRLGFWWGMVLIVLQLITRMFEYDTGLIFKSVILFFCGVSIILAGLWFERYLSTYRRENEL